MEANGILRDRSCFARLLKTKRDAEKERIIAQKAASRSQVTVYSNPNISDDSDEDTQQVESYNDEFTKERFGRENVTVTTTFGFDNSSDDEEEEVNNNSNFSQVDMLTPSEMKKKMDNENKKLLEKAEMKKRATMTKKAKKNLQVMNNNQKTKKSKFYSKGGGNGRRRRGKGGGNEGKKQKRVQGRSKHSRAGKKLRGKRK